MAYPTHVANVLLQETLAMSSLIVGSCPPKAKVTRSNRVGRANNIEAQKRSLS